MTHAGQRSLPPSEADLATRGSGIRLAAEVGGRLLSVATTFLLAASLGVERFGLFAASSGMAIIAAELSELGLQAAASRALVAGTLGLRALARAKLLVSALVALLALLLPPLVAGTAPRLAGPAFGLQTPLVLYYVAAGGSEFLGVALRARGRRAQEAAVLLLLRASTLLAVALALRSGAGLGPLAWAHFASTLPPLVLGILLVRRAATPEAAGDAPVRAVLAESLPLFINGALVLTSLRIELLALYFFRGAREAGLFGAALKMVESLGGLPAAVTAGAMPPLTREGLRAAAGEAAGDDVRRRLSGTVAILGVPAAAGLALEAPGLLGLLGAGYGDAAPVLRLLSPALVALFMNAVVVWSLIAVGRAGRLPGIMAVRVLLGVMLAAALIPPLGAVGGALSLVAGELTLLALASRACAQARFTVPVAGPLLRAAVLALPMAAAVSLARGRLALSIAIGALVYLLTLAVAWRWGLQREPTEG